jgi:hypothetical protein
VDRIATLDEVVSSVAKGYRPAASTARAYDRAELAARAAAAGFKMGA